MPKSSYKFRNFCWNIWCNSWRCIKLVSIQCTSEGRKITSWIYIPQMTRLLHSKWATLTGFAFLLFLKHFFCVIPPNWSAAKPLLYSSLPSPAFSRLFLILKIRKLKGVMWPSARMPLRDRNKNIKTHPVKREKFFSATGWCYAAKRANNTLAAPQHSDCCFFFFPSICTTSWFLDYLLHNGTDTVNGIGEILYLNPLREIT